MTWRPLPLLLLIAACLSPLRLRAMPAQKPSQQPISVSLSADHWTAVPLPFQAIWVGSHNGTLWACGWNEGIAKSSDGGKTWQVVHFRKNGEICLSLSFEGSQVVAPTTGGHLLRSRDGGKTWDLPLTLSIAPESIALCGNSAIALLPKVVAYTPSLRNVHWSVLSVKLPASPSGTPDVLSTELVACLDSTHWGFIVPGDGKATPPRFYTTANGGKRWKAVAFATSLSFSNLVVRNGAYDLIGKKEVASPHPQRLIFYSSDGKKWGSLPEPYAGPLGSCFDFVCQTGNGWEDFNTNPPRFWQLPKGHPKPATLWAFSNGAACATGPRMACAIAAKASAASLHSGANDSRTSEKGTRHAKCLKCENPPYPMACGEDGTELYKGVVTATGSFQNIVLIYTPCKFLVIPSLQALSHWRFSPALQAGKPVPTGMAVVIIWKQLQ